MSLTSNSAPTQSATFGAKLRGTAIGFLFATVLLIPKMLHLRRNENSWMLFRIVLGIIGAALVVVPLSLWNSYLLSVFGMLLFTAAILMPGAQPQNFVDDYERA